MKIAIVIFDDFTDIDLFLMWDILGREKKDWQVKILGTKEKHLSSNGLLIPTHGNIAEANDADVVLFSSGKGTRAVIKDSQFLSAFSLNPEKQIIGSVCSGALILAKLGLLKRGPATTHPRAKQELQALGVVAVDKPLVCNGNVATAGGCLSAQYLVGWLIERIHSPQKRQEALKEILPVGQVDIYEKIIASSIQEAKQVQKSVVSSSVPFDKKSSFFPAVAVVGINSDTNKEKSHFETEIIVPDKTSPGKAKL